MHQHHRLASVTHGVLQCRANETLGAKLRNGLEAEAGVLSNVPTEGFLDEGAQLLGVGAAGLEFETGVDVFGVLTKDHHVDVFGALDR